MGGICSHSLSFGHEHAHASAFAGLDSLTPEAAASVTILLLL